MHPLSVLQSIYREQEADFLAAYKAFLAFPSIATDPAYTKEVRACAAWVSHYLQGESLHVTTWETGGSPLLLATDLRAGPARPTLLFYCHYDVQPVDPLSAWISPPFVPTLREGNMYARGAADNKGQCFYTMAAIKSFLRQYPSPAVNLKFLIEGEEESGSQGLARLLKNPAFCAEVQADALLIVDSGIPDMARPTLTLGCRGIVCLEVTVREGTQDLHSGMAGGMAYNPNKALAEILAQLHTSTGEIAVPGFYDTVAPLSPEERSHFDFTFDAEAFATTCGFLPQAREKGFSPLEAVWIRPTLEINGISGGYAGEGFKTVIPATAHAKISCRLVPEQDPLEIGTRVAHFLQSLTPPGLETHVSLLPGNGPALRASPHAFTTQTVAQSYTDVFEKPCQYILIGGSIPIAAALAEATHAEPLLLGLGLPGDSIHAPNEHFSLERLEKGFLTIYRLLERFAQAPDWSKL